MPQICHAGYFKILWLGLWLWCLWLWTRLMVRVHTFNLFYHRTYNYFFSVRYREALRHISTDVRDRPLTPLDVFIYWVNYAIRHKGHTHLRSETTKKLSLVSYYMIDVVALVALLIFIIFTTLTIFGIVWVKYYISNAAKSQKKHNE